jgi:DNA-binding GntR family transcriptional regulator
MPLPAKLATDSPRTRREEVVAVLRENIVNGTLAPGEPLLEEHIARLLDVSNTPVREALRTLASDGLAEIQPNRGARVTTLTAKDAADVVAAYALLSTAIWRDAVHNLTDVDIVAMRAAHDESQRLARSGDFAAAMVSIGAFHQAAQDRCSNDVLITLINHVRYPMSRVTRLRMPSNLLTSLWDFQGPVIEALEAGDRIGAAERMADGWTFFTALMNTAEQAG